LIVINMDRHLLDHGLHEYLVSTFRVVEDFTSLAPREAPLSLGSVRAAPAA
jgi:hypothetical protein